MKVLERKIIYLLNAILLVMLISHSIVRDIRLDNQFPTDLRNRIVGARLQKDGRLPYHFHWQPIDGIRYYNTDESYWVLPDGNRFLENTGGAPINKITASPFFHELLFPICDLPQRNISRIWLCAEYLMLAWMVAMFCSLTTDKRKKWMLLNAGVFFTATEAWINLIQSGQFYFFLAFLLGTIIYFLSSKKKYGMIWGGIVAVLFILCRPLVFVFLIPFAFYIYRFKAFLLTILSGLFIYGFFVLVSPTERTLYQDYFDAMKSHALLHEESNPLYPPAHETEPYRFTELEGFNLSETNRQLTRYPIHINNENGNLFVLYFKVFRKKISPAFSSACFVFASTILALLFYRKNREKAPDGMQVLLLGFLIYMMAEIFGPVYRRQYNLVQWLPLLLAGILLVRNWKEPATLLLIAGLLFQIGHSSWLPMRHTIGECCWMIALFFLSLRPNAESLKH